MTLNNEATLDAERLDFAAHCKVPVTQSQSAWLGEGGRDVAASHTCG